MIKFNLKSNLYKITSQNKKTGLIIFVKSWVMKTNNVKETKTQKRINWALPDQSVTLDEFRTSIKEAEKGPFITLDEFDQRFEEWKRKKGL